MRLARKTGEIDAPRRSAETAKTRPCDGVLTAGIVPCYMMTQAAAIRESAPRAGDADRGNRLIPEPGAVTDNPREEP